MSLSRSSIATFALCSAAILAGCSTTGPAHRGAYYQNDGPGANPPTDIDAIPDAVPRIETYSKAASKPYTVFGKRYVPITDDRPFRQAGIASWYGRQFHGGKTSDGETYDMYAMTAAHTTLPIPSYARVTNTDNGKSVVVRVNDRGPFHSSRIMDLSYVAAAKLGIIGPGSAPVIVQAITNSDIARGIGTRTASAAAPTAAQLTASTHTPEARPAVSENRAPATIATTTPDALRALPNLEAAMDESHSSHTLAANDEWHDAMARNGHRAVSKTVAYDESAAPTSGSIYLQFGAFSAPENAQSLAQKLNRKIVSAGTASVRVKAANNMYRVQMGPYANRADAISAASRIKQQTGTEPALVAAR